MRLLSFLPILVLAIMLGACSGSAPASTSPTAAATATASQPQATKPAESANPTVVPTKSASNTVQPGAGDNKLFVEVPEYPGTTALTAFDFSEFTDGTTFNQDYDAVAWRALSSKDAPDQVVKFYKTELVKPQYGWQEQGWLEADDKSGGALGAYSKDNENKTLLLLIDRQTGDTNTTIILGRGDGLKKK